MNINQVFDKFCSELSNRTKFLSEDNIRFYWFNVMIQQDNNLDHYSLEEPYASLPGKELDLMYENETERFCIEIKFHRHTTNHTFAHTMSAGEIFDDIRRLPHWKPQDAVEKPTRFFLLYVTDDEMNRYLSGIGNVTQNKKYRDNLSIFYNVQEGSNVSLVFADEDHEGDTPETFMNCASASVKNTEEGILRFPTIYILRKQDISCKSKSLHIPKTVKDIEKNDNRNCFIRLYEIL